MTKKHEVVEAILKQVGIKGEKLNSKGESYFDILIDKSESHLEKLLKVSKILPK